MSVSSSMRSNADRDTMTADRPPNRRSRQNSFARTTKERPIHKPSVNVGEIERTVSAVGGGALALYGLTRGSLGGLALAGIGGCLLYRGISGHCDLYGALGVSTAGERGSQTSIPAGRGVKVEKTVHIQRPVEDLYLYWVKLENLPSFMRHLRSVQRLDERRSRWAAQGPLGTSAEWEAEVHTAQPNEMISWRSLPGSEVDTAGSVHFTPTGSSGTQVRVVLKYDPPAGRLGAALARLLGEDPEQQIQEDLHAFKRLMEVGGSPESRRPPAAR